MTLLMPNCHLILLSGLSSKAVRVLNSKYIFSDSCDNLHPNSGDDSSDPSSVSVRSTEDKNRQDCSQGDCQGTPSLQTRETGSWEEGVGEQ